jgi:hypothetical protein
MYHVINIDKKRLLVINCFSILKVSVGKDGFPVDDLKERAGI